MEEEKKVQEESQEETSKDQTEALLEPRPYKRKADKETDDTATDSEDTATENAATPEERPVNAEEKVFKKRYDDLKRHYDSTVNKHKDETLKLKRQLEDNADKIKLPKTKEEIEAWRAKYPDVYDVIETIAHTKADEKAKKWVSQQDSTIQGWLYENTTNAKLAARAIDLYKMDTGYGKKKSNKLEASKSVTSTSKREVDTGDKKIWTLDEIAKLRPQQFAKMEKEIDLARHEGRIRS